MDEPRNLAIAEQKRQAMLDFADQPHVGVKPQKLNRQRRYLACGQSRLPFLNIDSLFIFRNNKSHARHCQSIGVIAPPSSSERHCARPPNFFALNAERPLPLPAARGEGWVEGA